MVMLRDGWVKPTGRTILVIHIVWFSFGCECFLPAIGQRRGGVQGLLWLLLMVLMLHVLL